MINKLCNLYSRLRGNDKITRKEMSKLLLWDYNLVKRRRNMNFEEIDSEPSIEQNNGF